MASTTDSSLFIYSRNLIRLYVLVFVDDLVVTGSLPTVIDGFVTYLKQEFLLRDLGPFSFFLGIETLRSSVGLLISQQRYIRDLLLWTQMHNSKPAKTPLAANAKFTSSSSSIFDNAILYRRMVGSLQYLAFTCLDISYVVNNTC